MCAGFVAEGQNRLDPEDVVVPNEVRDPYPKKSLANRKDYFRNKSATACFITCPPTSAMDLVSGMSFGQISTQF